MNFDLQAATKFWDNINTELRDKIIKAKNENDYIMKTVNYMTYVFEYGLITMLKLIQRYEQDENYEECQKIIDSVKSLSEIVNYKFLDDDINKLLKDVQRDHFIGLSIKEIDLKYEVYCDELYDKLN